MWQEISRDRSSRIPRIEIRTHRLRRIYRRDCTPYGRREEGKTVGAERKASSEEGGPIRAGQDRPEAERADQPEEDQGDRGSQGATEGQGAAEGGRKEEAR